MSFLSSIFLLYFPKSARIMSPNSNATPNKHNFGVDLMPSVFAINAIATAKGLHHLQTTDVSKKNLNNIILAAYLQVWGDYFNI